MPNMSYCRFHNTLNDLRDCYRAMLDEEPVEGKDEQDAKDALLKLCARIVEEFGD